jgi:hypothetical protein
MESNNKNTNYEQGEQQLRKRKINELANAGQPAAAEGEEQQHQLPENYRKKICGEQQSNDDFEVCTAFLKSDFLKMNFLNLIKNLHLENLTREELIQLVQKQLHSQNEAHSKQLEAMKKEAEESAKEQTKEMTTKMEELKSAHLASQQKVEQLTVQMTNSAKQAEV